MTDAEKIDILMDTQRMLVARLARITVIADIMADEVGYGFMVTDIRHNFDRLARLAEGKAL